MLRPQKENPHMKKIKGLRKKVSIYRREACLKQMHGVFQKAYLAAKGTPKERFEIACKATDDEILKASNAEPQKKAFWLLVVEDFKQHLLTLVENEHLIEEAVKATAPELVEKV